MIKTKGYAVASPKGILEPLNFEREELTPYEVLIDILFCGICHADIRQSRNEYGNTKYPLVPGHEIVGRIKAIGGKVSRFEPGDLVGVGYFKDSCRVCASCLEKQENYCENGITTTQNAKLPNGGFTKGGYAQNITVDENYVLKVPENLDTAGVAPLLCAGITAYSALKNWKIGKGHRVAVVGLGGIGHMAIQFACSFGAEVTVFSRSSTKMESAFELGAKDFIISDNEHEVRPASGQFDFVIDSISALHDYNHFLSLLKKDGTMILLGVPAEGPRLSARMLISKRRSIGGSMIGSIAEAQEMLDYCGKKNITAQVEIIPPEYINKAFERTLKGEVQYRFVVDMRLM